MHLIIDSKNQQKFEGLFVGAQTLFGSQFSVEKIITEHLPDVRPLTKQEAVQAAKDGVHEVVRSYLKEDGRDKKPAIAVCFQKGTTVLDETGVPELICVVAVRKTNTGPQHVFVEECRPLPLDPQVRVLVQQGVAIYDAYGHIYGEKVSTKEKDLFEILCPDESVKDWFADGVVKSIAYVL